MIAVLLVGAVAVLGGLDGALTCWAMRRGASGPATAPTTLDRPSGEDRMITFVDGELCLRDRAVTTLAGWLLLALTPRSRARLHLRLLRGNGVPLADVPPDMLALAMLGRQAGT